MKLIGAGRERGRALMGPGPWQWHQTASQHLSVWAFEADYLPAFKHRFAYTALITLPMIMNQCLIDSFPDKLRMHIVLSGCRIVFALQPTII